MPQDSLRSVVYRSFVTCDDPKGVAESKTIRKSKRREPKSKNSSKSELQKLSDSQVMEVSRGAEKLSQVIGSLSNRPSFDTTSDLLRGALDLQESLVMLGKFQEASKLIANSASKKKKKKEVEVDFHGFEKPGVSAARDCYDELREVIKESFTRQNLLPRVSDVDVDRRNSQLCVDLPSSSGSSSLHYAHSSCSSPPRVRGGEKMKGSNLIAKLMGLEEVPSKAGAIFTKVEKEKKERVPLKRGLLLDIELPRARNPPEFMVKKVVRERRTLEEIIETMQFKGILERKCVDGYNDCKLYTNPSFLSAAEGPPIVIMKPLRGEEPRPHRDWIIGGEQHLKSRPMPRKPREESPPRAQPKVKETNEKSAAKQKVDRGKEEKNVGRVRVRPAKKAVDSQDRVSTKRMNQSKPLLPPILKKEGVQKIEKIAKLGPNTRKVGETKDDDKPQTLKQSRANMRENNVSKSQIARGKAAAGDKSTKPTPLSSTSPKKRSRRGEPKSKSSSSLSVENRASDGNSAINSETIISECSLVKNTEPEQTTEEACYIFDDSRNAENFPGDDLGTITKDVANHTEDDSCIPSFDSDQIKGCRDVVNTRYLLLSSVSFLNHVEELFDTGTDGSIFLHTTCLHDGGLLHHSLLLDCAKEILEHKSLCCRSMRNQWSENFSRRPKCHLSVEKLVEEICTSMEDLQKYSESLGDSVLADSIYPMLDRDLWWNEEVTGSWGSGWRKGYAMETVDEVMHDLEELVLSEMVAEMMVEAL